MKVEIVIAGMLSYYVHPNWEGVVAQICLLFSSRASVRDF